MLKISIRVLVLRLLVSKVFVPGILILIGILMPGILLLLEVLVPRVSVQEVLVLSST